MNSRGSASAPDGRDGAVAVRSGPGVGLRFLGASDVFVGAVCGWWSAFLRSGTALRSMPDLVRGPAFVGASLVLPAVVLYAHSGFLVTSRRLVTWVFMSVSQRQLRLRRARLRERWGCWWCWGWRVVRFESWWLSPVGSFSSPGTLRRPVNLPGGQAAVALVDAGYDLRRLTPRQNHW